VIQQTNNLRPRKSTSTKHTYFNFANRETQRGTKENKRKQSRLPVMVSRTSVTSVTVVKKTTKDNRYRWKNNSVRLKTICRAGVKPNSPRFPPEGPTTDQHRHKRKGEKGNERKNATFVSRVYEPANIESIKTRQKGEEVEDGDRTTRFGRGGHTCWSQRVKVQERSGHGRGRGVESGMGVVTKGVWVGV